MPKRSEQLQALSDALLTRFTLHFVLPPLLYQVLGDHRLHTNADV